MAKISLVPLGAIDPALLAFLEERLGSIFDTVVEMRSAAEPPDYAYDPHRRQYLSTAILEDLKALPRAKDEKLLGVVEVDLFVPRLNFVFGEAEMGGRVAVISLCRLKQEFYGLPPLRGLFWERALKEAVHELGHTYGLGHCPNSKCVMHFSNSLADTDNKGYSFCPHCLIKG